MGEKQSIIILELYAPVRACVNFLSTEARAVLGLSGKASVSKLWSASGILYIYNQYFGRAAIFCQM